MKIGLNRYLVWVGLLVPAIHSTAFATALDDYVALPDSSFSWSFDRYESVGLLPAYTTYYIDLTSQTWREGSEVDRPVWTHKLTISRPRFSGAADTALLIVGGGVNDDVNGIAEPDTITQEGKLAWATGSVICHLTTVPNQPLLFSDANQPVEEDAIIAYSWNKYFQDGDPNWPVQLPMVKAIVRAMDVIQAYLTNPDTGSAITVNHFTLTGGSKRGWVCWLAAAADQRVVAVAPLVADLLKLEKIFAHHWGAYGAWSPAVQDYVDAGIFQWSDTPQMESLLDIVDPIRYLDRFANLSKLMVYSAGDEFFVLDSNHFYFDRLVAETGETYLRHVPNSNHALDGKYDDVLNSMAPFWNDFLHGNPRPQFTWNFPADGAIRVETADSPLQVTLWQSANPAARDFRLDTIGAAWTGQTLTDQGGGVYVGQVTPPAGGWAAFFVELIFASGSSIIPDYTLTTQVRVLPETLPFATDFDRNQVTDVNDLLYLAQYWLTGDCVRDIYPLYGDGIVNGSDFTVFGVE